MLLRFGPMLGSVALLVLLACLVLLWPQTSTAVLIVLNLRLLAHLVLQGLYWRDSMQS